MAEVSTYIVYQGWAARQINSERVGKTIEGGELVNEEWKVAEVSTYKVHQGWAAQLGESTKNSGRRRTCK